MHESLVFAHSSGGDKFKGEWVDYQVEHESPSRREAKHAQTETRHVACANADLCYQKLDSSCSIACWLNGCDVLAEKIDDTEWLTFNSLCSSVVFYCSALLRR